MNKLIALHNCWIIASGSKRLMLGRTPIEDPLSRLTDPSDRKSARRNAKLLRLASFYAHLYVVVEGYRAAKFQDVTLAGLLSDSKNRNSLRDCRNAVLHCQNEPLSRRLLNFLTSEEANKWILKVHFAFAEFFEENLPVQETLNYLRKHYA